MKKWLTASVLMGGIATCRKIKTEAEVEAEEVEAAWKLTTYTSLVGLKVYWFTYENPVAGKSNFNYQGNKIKLAWKGLRLRRGEEKKLNTEDASYE